MLVRFRHSIILCGALSDVSANVGGLSSLMLALGVRAVRVYAIDGLVGARARRIYYLKYYRK